VGHDFVVRVDGATTASWPRSRSGLPADRCPPNSEDPSVRVGPDQHQRRQTITVTAITPRPQRLGDGQGHGAGRAAGRRAGGDALGGVHRRSGAFSLSGLVPSLIMFALFARRKRVQRRRRLVTGALEGAPHPFCRTRGGAARLGRRPPSAMPGADGVGTTRSPAASRPAAAGWRLDQKLDGAMPPTPHLSRGARTAGLPISSK